MNKNIIKIRSFWAKNSKFLLKVGVIAFFAFYILRVLNGQAKVELDQKELENKNAIIEEKIQKQQSEKEKEDKEFISKFVEYCNKNDIESAYELLSDSCKKERFGSIDIFKENYIKRIFNTKKDFNIEKVEQGYKITFLEDILQSGKIEGREINIKCYCNVEEDILGIRKIYISL